MLRQRAAVVFATFVAVGCAHAASTASSSQPRPSADPEAIARTFVDQLGGARFAAAEEPFSAEMWQGLPPDQLGLELELSHARDGRIEPLGMRP